MKLIPLTLGKFARVDDEDYEALSKMTWWASKTHVPGLLYAYRRGRPQTNDWQWIMHRMITNAPKGMMVDHIDHDGLNNQKSNLRICSRSENGLNRKDIDTMNSSGVVGVYFHKPTGKWQAKPRYNGKLKSLGLFNSLEEAAMRVVTCEPIDFL